MASKQQTQQRVEIVRACYTYKGEDQQMSLPFAESAVLLVVERADDGWCRGFARGKQGWFPASYVKSISDEQITKVRHPPIPTGTRIIAMANTVTTDACIHVYYRVKGILGKSMTLNAAERNLRPSTVHSSLPLTGFIM